MSDWTGGYVADVAYTEQAYREMAPLWLSLAALLNGQPPLETAKAGFTYVELGCGNGLTSCLVAATTPGADVWGFDFNPAHVERARRLAAWCGLTNCRFEEAAFEELASRSDIGPASADVITLHGIYSWITEQNQRHVVDVIRRRLEPGGLVYVSYNVATGWATLLPIQEALRLHVFTDGRRSDVAIRAAVATIAQLADDGARSFPLGPQEQSTFDGLGGANDPAYVAHEYLGGSFAPTMFADVSADLAGAKCSFVGSAHPADAVPNLRVVPDLEADVRAAPDVAVRETLCDIAGSRTFRTDVFRRGLAAVRPGDQRQWIDEMVLVATGQPYDPERQVQGVTARARLDEAHYRPLVYRLAQGPLAGRELRELPPLAGKPESELLATVALLVAGGYAVPGTSDWESSGAAESVARMNAVLVELARQGQPHGFVAAAGGGTAVALDPLATLAVGELWDGAPSDGESLRARVAERVASLGWMVSPAGVDGHDPIGAAARTAVELVSGAFVGLGVAGPSPAGAPPPRPGPAPAAARAERHGPVTIAPGVAWVAVDGDVVALDERDGVHVIDATGALIWPLLDGTATNDELAADVADVFGVPPEQARDDVDRFVVTMTGLGLVAVETP